MTERISTISDPDTAWDCEPKWDTELTTHWEDVENPIQLPGPSTEAGVNNELIHRHKEEMWVAAKGQYLGIILCIHACRTVQGGSSECYIW